MRTRPFARPRDERGAMAIMFTLLVVMLLTVAALGTDLGNAWARKTDTQNQADFAAFDVAIKYPAEVTNAPLGPLGPGVLCTEINERLEANLPQDDDDPVTINVCDAANSTVDGHAEMIVTAGGQKALRVITPTARVNFGFANVFGTSGRDVRSDAAVGIFTAGPRILPMFAVAGCDWGRQTLTSPANAEENVPDLEFPLQSGPARPNAPTVYDAGNNVVTTLNPGSPDPYVLVMDASQWQKTWKIGFFREGGDPRRYEVEGTDIRSAANTTLPAGPPLVSLTGSTAVNIVIPPEVYEAEGTWWIRAWGGENTIDDPGNEWSPVNPSGPYQAPSIQVGTPVLECDAGPSEGNFGTIKLPRNIPYIANHLPANIANGIQEPLSLTVHAGADSTGICDHGTAGAVESDTALRPKTNCVDTDTGLPANVATEGFISYNSGNGLLAKHDTRDGCDPDGGSDERAVDVVGNSDPDYDINDDILSCFLKPGRTLAEVTADDYAGGSAFIPELLESPRFAYVPVFEVRPTCGGCQQYSIVDFRPAFITDQDPTCSAPSYCATADNGVTIGPSGVTHMKVVFFHIDSLPSDDSSPTLDYLGVGKPVVHLID